MQVNSAIAQAYYIHPDQLGTPRMVTSSNGAVVWQWDNSDPFGANIPNENPNGAGQFNFNLRFPGQYFDKETNTHQNYFRDYDPALGRYTQFDPIGLRGGINGYVYVLNNPLSYTDPTGESIPLLLLCVGVLGAINVMEDVALKAQEAEQRMQQQSSNVAQCNQNNNACNAAQNNLSRDLQAVGATAKAGAKLPGTLSGGKLPSPTQR